MSIFTGPLQGGVTIARPQGFFATKDYLTITVDGTEVPAIVTQVSIENQSNYQFLHSLENLVYVYSFGDRVGTTTIAGIGFVRPCGSYGGIAGAVIGGSFNPLNRMDIMKVAKNYQTFKGASNQGRQVKIVDVVISNYRTTVELRGVCTSMRADMLSENDGICTWSIGFKTILTSAG